MPQAELWLERGALAGKFGARHQTDERRLR
jgi:hypothetical protein